jgi:hypothetical protein
MRVNVVSQVRKSVKYQGSAALPPVKQFTLYVVPCFSPPPKTDRTGACRKMKAGPPSTPTKNMALMPVPNADKQLSCRQEASKRSKRRWCVTTVPGSAGRGLVLLAVAALLCLYVSTTLQRQSNAGESQAPASEPNTSCNRFFCALKGIIPHLRLHLAHGDYPGIVWETHQVFIRLSKWFHVDLEQLVITWMPNYFSKDGNYQHCFHTTSVLSHMEKTWKADTGSIWKF